MFSFLSNKQPASLTINGSDQVIDVQKNETILSAALRAGIAFPNSCRVGGCASCKCKLSQGEVRELTESSYVLSKEELEQGYILACQSVPKGAVGIELQVDHFTEQFKAQELTGKVIVHKELTHDISQIEIQLPEALSYAAGQFAQLTLPALSQATRAYSFATPASQGNKVSFYIKHMLGGEFSSMVQLQDLMGQKMIVNGPFGDFYLRESDAPIVCIAGGSGLAPIKALLEKALIDNVRRDVVFLFGARTQADLYCLDEINKIKENWPVNFEFIPVLSNEPIGSSWDGKTGYITAELALRLTGQEQAYLCGPPAMIDSAITVLNKHSVISANIFFDKFIEQTAEAVA